MTRRITILCGALAAAGMFAASASRAEGLVPTSGYLLPQVSVFDPDDDYGVKGRGTGGGLRVGIPVTDDIDIQFSGGYARRSATGSKVEQTQFGVEALYLFSRSDVRPFVSIGGGVERDTRTRLGAETRGTSPYLSGGLGVQWMFSPSFGLQVDYRRVEGFLRNNAVWGFKRSSNDYFNVGLLWTFGAEPDTAPPPPRPIAAAPAPVFVPPPAPPAPPPPPPPPPAPQRMTLSANSLFELNSARIASPVAELDTLAAALQSNPQVTNVVITGHTDQLGSAAVNRRLSQERADAVKAYLVGKGIAANRLTARGVGSSQLVTECQLPTRAEMIKCGTQNRRVEIEPITVAKR